MFCRCLSLLLTVILAVPALAQVLAEKVPADCVVYVGWKGADTIARQYQQTHLKAVLESTDLSMLLNDQFQGQLIKLVTRENPQAAKDVATMMSAAKSMWRYPTVFCVGAPRQGDVMPRLGILCAAGQDAKVIADALHTQAGGDWEINVQEDMVVAVMGVWEGFPAAAPGGALAASPTFKATIKQVDAEGVVVAYGDMRQLLAGAAQAHPDADAAKIQKALGLDGFRRIAFSGGFQQADWTLRGFIESPQPRSGLARLLDGKPFSEQMLQLVPKSAAVVQAGQCDFAATLDEIRSGMQAYSPDSAGQFDQVMMMANGMMKMNLRDDLLVGLGSEWVAYADANVGGMNLLGWVLVNRPRDPAKVEKGLTQLQTTLCALANANLRRQKMVINPTRKQAGNVTINCVPLPLVAPSWAIQDGTLYVGLFPQVVQAAVQYNAAKKPTLLDNPAFVAMRKRFPAGAMSLEFTDLPQTVGANYGLTLMLSRYVGFLDLFGVQTPTILMPPLPVMREHLAPSASACWNDVEGWHMQSLSPFPLADALASEPSSNLMAAQPEMMVSILLPALTRAREKANQVKCASNMRQIGQGIMLFANDHKGKFPDDLGALLDEGIAPVVVICPSAVSPQTNWPGLPQDKQREWINANSQYTYLGKGLDTNVNPETPVLYENPQHHSGEGANVLFADGHVEFVMAGSLNAILGKKASANGAGNRPGK